MSGKDQYERKAEGEKGRWLIAYISKALKLTYNVGFFFVLFFLAKLASFLIFCYTFVLLFFYSYIILVSFVRSCLCGLVMYLAIKLDKAEITER